VGIISGILTSALIFLAISIFEKVVIPWYQAIIYRGVEINGEWHMERSGSNQTAIFNLEQSAHKIKGIATFVTKESTPDDLHEIRTFTVDGQISERFVTLVLKHKDKQRLGISAYLLEIVGDGRKMQGYISGYSIASSKIISSACELVRKNK
jgi:hypothetical protein